MREGGVVENLDHVTEAARRTEASAEGPMVSQEQWGAIRSLSERGMARKAIARQLGIDVRTVRRYLRRGGRAPYCRSKPVLEARERDHGKYLRQRAPAVQWVAQVLFQEVRARGFRGGYEVIKRWVRPLREEQERIEAATVRFETAGGRQAQADWGTTRVEIAGAWTRIHVFVLPLGFSRRLFARAYPHERLAALIDAHERWFRHFGGRTEEILYDNPRTIVMRRDCSAPAIF